jgi:ribosomal-protein-alanine N-acetyltransferase
VSVVIRAALPADAATLASLHAGSFADGWSQADFANWLARADAFGAVADVGGEPVGFVMALTSGDDAEILTIATNPSNRQMGIGRNLVVAMLGEARKRGLARVLLEVARDNAAALALYRATGFVEIGVRKAYYRRGTVGVDAITMSVVTTAPANG